MALTRIKTDQILDGTITGSDIASGTDIASNNLTLTGDLRGPSIFTIDPAAIGDNTGTVVIAGDLQVDGETTTINSSTLTVDDKQIVIASGATDNTSADGAGILIDGANATITYDGTNDRFEINKDVQIIGGSISGTDVDVSDATFTVANDQISGDAINGGTATPTTLYTTNLSVNSPSDTDATLLVKAGSTTTGVHNARLRLLARSSNNAQVESHIESIGTGGANSILSFAVESAGITSEAARIDSSGNVGIGTTSPSEKLEVNGNVIADGVYLGGTGTANKLDDYEEGTFDLTLTIGGSTGSTNLGGNSSGTYVKIGRLVFCTMRLSIDSIDTSLSGNVAIEGLPFPATDNPDGDGVAGAHFRRLQGVSFTGQLIAGAGFGATFVTFDSLNTNGSDTDITENDIDNGFSFEGSITYYTDS